MLKFVRRRCVLVKCPTLLHKRYIQFRLGIISVHDAKRTRVK